MYTCDATTHTSNGDNDNFCGNIVVYSYVCICGTRLETSSAYCIVLTLLSRPVQRRNCYFFFFFFESEIPIGFSNLHKTKWYNTHIPLTFLISLCRIISAGSIALANPINANFVFFLFDVCIYVFRPLYEIKYTRATHLQSSDYYRANELIFISHVKDKSVL